MAEQKKEGLYGVMAEFVCDRYEVSGVERREGDRRSDDSSS